MAFSIDNISKRLWFVLGAIFVLIFIISLSYTWSGLALTLKYNLTDGERITGLGSFFQSVLSPAARVRGILPNFLMQLYAVLLGKFLFAICNALVYILLTSTMVRLAGASRTSYHCILSMGLLVLILTDYSYNMPAQIATVWMALLAVVFIRVYNICKYADQQPPLWVYPLLVILGLIAGNGNIYISAGIFFALAINFLRKRDLLEVSQYCLIFGFAVGFLLSLMYQGLRRPDNDILVSVLSFIKYSKALYILLVVYFYVKINAKRNLDKFYKHHSFIVNCLTGSILYALFGGVSAPSQLIGSEIFAAIITLTLIKRRYFLTPTMFVLGAVVVTMFVCKFTVIATHDHAIYDIRRQIGHTETGMVFADLPTEHMFIHPTDGPTFTNEPNLERELEALADDRIGSSYTIKRNNGIKISHQGAPLKVFPKLLLDLIQKRQLENLFAECKGNVFLFVQDCSDPAQFVITRDFGVPGFVMDRDEETIEIDQLGTTVNIDGHNYRFLAKSFVTPLTLSRSIELVK